MASKSFGHRVRFLGAVGTIVAYYAMHVESQLEQDPFYEPACNTSWGSCAAVFTSAYAKPLSLWGLVPAGSAYDLSLAKLGIANYLVYVLYRWCVPWKLLRRRDAANVLFALSLGSVGFSVYLLYVLKVILKDFCIVCTTFHTVNFSMLFFAVLPERRAALADANKSA
jgi:uncharacterized membrane protein